MKIQKMDKQLLEINQIKDIISIDYKDIYYNGQQEKGRIIPGFLVFYGNLKHLFITVLDPYFEDFVRIIRNVYLEEKDRVVVDGVLGPKKIEITPFTETLLLNGDLDTTSSLYRFYKGKEYYKESLLFESDKVKSLFKIIEYHLKETLQLFDKTLGRITISEGVNGSYYLKTTINNTKVLLPIFIEEQDQNKYKVIIGNVLEDSIPIHMMIEFTNDTIKVNRRIEEYDVTDTTIYQSQDEVTKQRDVYLRGRLLVYKKEPLEKILNPIESITRLDNKEKQPTWYLLPWNAYLGLKEEKEFLNEMGERVEEETCDQLVTKQMTYCTSNEESFYVKEMISKRYQRKTEKTVDSIGITFDHLNKTIIGLKQENGYIIETSFKGPAKTGFYKTNLDGKYYYHISREKQLELLKDTMISLSKEDGLEEKVDLLDIKKYEKK